MSEPEDDFAAELHAIWPDLYPPPPRAAPRGRSIDTKRVVGLYTGGMSVPEIRAETGHSLGSIRAVLREAKVEMRDDRKTRSGGKNRIKAYPPELVNEVRRLYDDEGLTQSQVAARLGITAKVVQSVMSKHQITARPRASEAGVYQGVDRASGLKARIAELGGTAVIREWALRAGIPVPSRGIPPASVVEAYARHQGENAPR